MLPRDLQHAVYSRHEHRPAPPETIECACFNQCLERAAIDPLFAVTLTQIENIPVFTMLPSLGNNGIDGRLADAFNSPKTVTDGRAIGDAEAKVALVDVGSRDGDAHQPTLLY